ncbi:MAG: aromatic-ring-hydroxylating dioxygenase subunit beta [Ramlibacter sp.]|jgi:3-phenylpropionate/cinnamic acid dioxygenase small subunit|nr:aromatic-ring-hydroxylating dioxygenase subunit beta [Ramlibacter sp.]MDB5911663.1 aromatic-ring-hydroxylating dioxygenase subunit beta [Ramlibacter sp.]
MKAASIEQAHAAVTVLAQEALHLDGQRWDEWLALFTPDASFWMPAWTDEHRLAQSPESELSLIYCTARASLEDRVWRVRSGLSVASRPLPRTTHCVTNPVVTQADEPAALHVESSWTCHVFGLKQRSTHVFHGRYEHLLRLQDDQWRIARKKVVLMNDTIPTMLDFYCI